jgi:ornithine cyclodeaminase/alanine dehydrogenase-like protein (mu-crystallin family)
LFAARLCERLGLDVISVATVAEAVDGADIVTCITTATDPILRSEDLAPGMHVNAAGSNSAARAELDAAAIRRAGRIFVDDVAQARLESGDLIRAYERNALNWAAVHPLADVVAGLTPGRRSLEDITLFESHGLALWDVALAAEVYERAQEQNVGDIVAFLE